MKKVFALLMAALLFCTMASAFADEDPVVMNRADYEAGAPAGETVSFETPAFTLWIPAGLEQTEIPEEDLEYGDIAWWICEDCFNRLTVNYDNGGFIHSIDDLKDYLAERPDWITNISDVVVNGVSGLRYSTPSSEMLAFFFDDGYGLVFASELGEDHADFTETVFASVVFDA